MNHRDVIVFAMLLYILSLCLILVVAAMGAAQAPHPDQVTTHVLIVAAINVCSVVFLITRIKE